MMIAAHEKKIVLWQRFREYDDGGVVLRRHQRQLDLGATAIEGARIRKTSFGHMQRAPSH